MNDILEITIRKRNKEFTCFMMELPEWLRIYYDVMMHRTKVKRRFMLARNRRIDLGPLGHEEVAKCLRIRQFSGFRVFGGLRGAVRPVDGAACQWHAFSTDRVGRRDRLAPT